MADPNAKLSSLFGKKKKKSKTVNATALAKKSAQAESAAADAAKPAAEPAKPAAEPAKPAAEAAKPAAAVKVLGDLSVGQSEQEEKTAFQWAKQPKKYKNMDEKEKVPTTWAEQQERSRNQRRLALDSERAFPTLGMDSARAQLSTMKAPQAKAVETKNAWSSLHDHDEDSD